VIEFQLVANRRRSCSSVKVNFKDIALRSRDARGIRVTVYPVEKINVLDRGRQADPNAPEEEEAPDSPEQLQNGEQPMDGQPAQDAAQPTENNQPEETKQSEENAQPDKPKLKKRIDEDSPFFLE
ncbi:MAG: hypothetical protein IKZ84_03525, partial [Victivallales bacterium]|nr:hypothetical protein [Victivallales bacterium]